MVRLNRNARGSGAHGIDASPLESVAEIARAHGAKTEAVRVTAMVYLGGMVLAGRRRLLVGTRPVRAGQIHAPSGGAYGDRRIAIMSIGDQRLYGGDANSD